jgi:hypothetical protein
MPPEHFSPLMKIEELVWHGVTVDEPSARERARLTAARAP